MTDARSRGQTLGPRRRFGDGQSRRV
jgi:hypothetical protein